MKKILHFNLSGNRFFKDQEPEIIIEDIGRCMEEEDTEENEAIAEEYYYDHLPTLRDISILLYQACGQGVLWNIARELAWRLNIDKKDILIALENIIGEYAEMSEEEAIKKYDEFAVYIKTSERMPEEK